MTDESLEVEKPEECSSCGWKTTDLTRDEQTGSTVSVVWLCPVCSGTLAGNAAHWPSHYHQRELLQHVSYCTNLILQQNAASTDLVLRQAQIAAGGLNPLAGSQGSRLTYRIDRFDAPDQDIAVTLNNGVSEFSAITTAHQWRKFLKALLRVIQDVERKP